MSAWICGGIGISACFWIGLSVLGLNPGQILSSLLVSQIAGFFALILILQAEKIPFLKKTLLSRPLRTWVIFLILYFGPLLGINESLRNLRNFLWLVIPLVLSTGFTILAFGPVQDFLVAQAQRRSRKTKPGI